MLAGVSLPSAAQYPGQVTNADKNAPTLRAVAVFEWTGDEAQPKASRIVPVCVYDGQELQDAGEYLARPAPIALYSDVEYQLFRDGRPVGLFDVDRAGQQEGSWVGFGKWKPMPSAKPRPTQVAKIDQYDDAQSDVPILHRKHHDGDANSGGASGGSTNGSGPDPNAPPPDPDRPTLHKSGDAAQSNAGDSSTSGSSNTSSGSGASNTGSTQASNSGGPTLHRGGDANPSANSPSTSSSPGSSSESSASANDSDRPQLKKKKSDDGGYVSNVETPSDTDRPHLFRGKSAGFDGPVTPSLLGMPSEMQQEVAVSDAADRPEHIWDYAWANPDDEARMKAAMEDLARTALGLNPPAAPAKPAHKSTSTAHKPKQLALPPQPAPLADEQFRVFELAYGSGATMVLSAHTEGSGAEQKFVTLIGQPDLYGNVAVLVRNVTDADHLDATPHMRLVDAVDVLADNRGELLFELRGATERQFALYRVLRGDATRIFVSDADAIGVPSGQ